MRIIDLLNINAIDRDGKPVSKSETIEHLVNLMDATRNISDKEAFRLACSIVKTKGPRGLGKALRFPMGNQPR